ncbi:hypothetical protein BN874_1760018 [Candidatus Contendobacter odensis Run_B_J11]|uniref:Uncharacterized protein n=1 Tax=Candidatus Contendobacter odensis Run_B_J11 TaxID=1400861 RepID=A0A7U7GAK1_9GAMM|nr:hypothetical protein BN874_1760018 [Candidatus Contendobacter odensis Run_B_J11]
MVVGLDRDHKGGFGVTKPQWIIHGYSG